MKKIFLGFVLLGLFWVFSGLTATTMAAGYIFVDGASQSSTEDGSEANPYKTIGSALAKAAVSPTSGRQIFIKKGTYPSGDLDLPTYTTLLGEDRNKVIIDFSADGKASLTMRKRSTIEKLTVKGGNYSVIVQKKAKVTIKNVKITKSKRIGIWVRSGKNRTVYSTTIKDSFIEDNDGKGLYIEQTYLYFYNNSVLNNQEEGLDLRSKVKGKIYDSTFEDNGEGGMELEIRGVKLDVRNNDFKSNEASGLMLNNRTNKGGKVSFKNNKFEDNNHYGIRCGGTRSWSNQLWKKTFSFKNNDINDNDKGDIDSACANR